MRGLNGTHTRITLALLIAGSPAIGHAQAIGSWSLPEPDSTSSAPAPQGPVDAQNPILRPEAGESTPGPAPSAKPAAKPTPAPLITAAPPPPAEPTARTTAKPAPPKATTPSLRPVTQAPAPEPTASDSSGPVEPAAQPEQLPTRQTTEPETAGAEHPSWPAWWWTLPAGIAAIALALFLLRRRRPQEEEWADTGEAVAEAQAESSPAARPLDSASRRPLPEPAFTPAPPKPVAPPKPAPATVKASPALISVDLEPVAMRLSLFYATLQYRLTLSAEEARGPITVSGDMISAHASLSQEQQLGPQVQDMARRHDLQALAAGEPVQLKGEIQLPLSEIRAMRQGDATLFVPLVRLCLTGPDGLALRRVFTLGIPGGGAGLSPLRTDTGPRTFEPLAAREIEAARQIPLQTETLPLDPQRAAG